MDKGSLTNKQPIDASQALFQFVIGETYLDHSGPYKVLSIGRGMVEIERPDGARSSFDQKNQNIMARIHSNLTPRPKTKPTLQNIRISFVGNDPIGFSQWETFPFIAAVIEKLAGQTNGFASDSEIVLGMTQDSALGPMLAKIVAADPKKRKNTDWAAIMMAWFSQKMSVGANSHGKRFERTDTQPVGYRLREAVAPLTQTEALLEFHNDGGESTHDKFQDWRRANDNGLFINVKSENNAMLHQSLCPHSGNTYFEEGAEGSLTNKLKICSNNREELLNWAIRKGITLKLCRDCKP